MHFDAAAFDGGNDTVERVLDLLGQALSILDRENLLIAAAKIDEVRSALRDFAGPGQCRHIDVQQSI
ncbi:hypothetical protein [Novosphingobium sp.]|uniref:hypothetical protein n=1 Tax=Novosphingobium sp. TaxID=1874826 RepID=UPI003B5256A1